MTAKVQTSILENVPISPTSPLRDYSWHSAGFDKNDQGKAEVSAGNSGDDETDDSDTDEDEAEFKALAVQAGGHAYSFFQGGTRMPGKVLKELDPKRIELNLYQALKSGSFKTDPFRNCIPKFYSVLEGRKSKCSIKTQKKTDY